MLVRTPILPLTFMGAIIDRKAIGAFPPGHGPAYGTDATRPRTSFQPQAALQIQQSRDRGVTVPPVVHVAQRPGTPVVAEDTKCQPFTDRRTDQ